MQIFPLIQSLQLLNHLTDDAPTPTILKESGESISNPKFDEWMKTDLLLRSWITDTLSKEALGVVVGMTTAHEIWTSLEVTYLQATKEREIQLKRQLCSNFLILPIWSFKIWSNNYVCGIRLDHCWSRLDIFIKSCQSFLEPIVHPSPKLIHHTFGWWGHFIVLIRTRTSFLYYSTLSRVFHSSCSYWQIVLPLWLSICLLPN